MIAVVDYKTANIGSIVNLFKRIGVAVRIAESPAGLAGASGIVLPGVGHFDACSRALRTMGFAEALAEPVLQRNIPLLGICVGAQLLLQGSEEGDLPGLGWIAGRALRFDAVAHPGIRVPHMGWNEVVPCGPDPLFRGLEQGARFYFAHSFHLTCSESAAALAMTTHGGEFPSAIGRGSIRGVQFHPEKSHRFGLQLFRNFAGIVAPAAGGPTC